MPVNFSFVPSEPDLFSEFYALADCYVSVEMAVSPYCQTIAVEGTQAWGRGGPETGFNGVLMFGMFLAVML